MPILTAADAAWLSVTYPALQPNTESTEVRGSISFSAGYDEAAGDFAIQRHADVLPPGLVLSGAFDLVIKELAPVEGERRLLPRLYLPNNTYPATPHRHFNADDSGCLCGPSEEALLVRQGYLFPQFLEELGLPFLYAQLHVDLTGRWPWPSYDHGTVGVFESYAESGCPENLLHPLLHLHAKANWPALRSLLTGRKRPYGHMPCACGSGVPIRCCHPLAWDGLKKMYADVHSSRQNLLTFANQ
jgi:hypothetical protein